MISKSSSVSLQVSSSAKLSTSTKSSTISSQLPSSTKPTSSSATSKSSAVPTSSSLSPAQSSSSTSSTNSKSSSSTTVSSSSPQPTSICTPAPAPPVTFTQVGSGGQGCNYNDASRYRQFSGVLKSIQTLNDICAADRICRGWAETAYLGTSNGNVPMHTDVWLFLGPYNASEFICSDDPAPDPYMSTSEYFIDDYTPPTVYDDNGSFETGCFAHWTDSSYSVSNGSVVACNKGLSGDCVDGNNYYEIKGDGSSFVNNQFAWPATVSYLPAIPDSGSYKFSFWVKGTSGKFQVAYGAATTFVTGMATGQWVKKEITWTGYPGKPIYFEFNAPGVFDWKVDGLTIVKV
ncbi:hypothetical protein BT63DRAFT_426591 [Microthyrium microscopicum]|uniref:Uncharacterized protein n=1 Tax=Microthyrium microscopicum TaxID=703497 RepID=A0A6A6UA18_9PEZI|nr:hypothetical protein BT63DRAFT_426591 [Microthyrium microscopicum]